MAPGGRRPVASRAVTDERFARVGDLELCYDTVGDADDPVMLLVMGLGFQLIHWPDALCGRLAAAGFRVVRFDNRDAGRSTHLPGARYTLDDLADDTAGLLDALGVESAHVVGASMGGMIAQSLAIRHPGRVRSLASLMSTTGRRGVGRTSPRVLRHLFARRPRTEDEAIERRVRVFADVVSSVRGPGHRGGDPRGAPGTDRGNGPRPAAGRVAAPRRRDHRKRGSGRALGPSAAAAARRPTRAARASRGRAAPTPRAGGSSCRRRWPGRAGPRPSPARASSARTGPS